MNIGMLFNHHRYMYVGIQSYGGQASIVDLAIVGIKINLIFLTMWPLCAMLQLRRVKDDSRGLELMSQQPNDVKLHLPFF